MKYLKYPFFVLLSGSCTGLFLYVQSLSAVLSYPDKDSGPSILWALPPRSRLGAYLLVTNLVFLFIWISYSFVCSRLLGKSLKSSIQSDAYTYLPLCILALSLTQFNILLTYHLKVFLIFAQSTGYLLLILAFIVVVYLKLENLWELRNCTHRKRVPSHLEQVPTWKGKLLVFLFSLFLYLLVGFRVMETLGPGGDEPHYLLITHSILYDRDLAMTNNYRQQDYKSFHKGELDKHVSIGRDGTRYPGHPIGLPLLLLPAYALRGYQGAVLLMNILAAWLALQLYLLAFSLTQSHRISLFLWFLTSFTSPLLLYSSQLYPEVPSALLLVIAYRRITAQGSEQLSKFIILGLSLGLLPWLQQRMILPSIILLGYHLFQKRQPGLSTAIPTIFLCLSGIAMAGFYYILYGNPFPSAPYTSLGIEKVFSPGILVKQGLLGLLLDQEAGLLIYSPYYLFLFPGVLLLVRHHFTRAFWLLLLILSIYLPVGGFTLQWYGAWSPASRYMVVLVPFFLVFLCVGVTQVTQKVYRYIFFFLGILSFCWTYLLLKFPLFSLMSGRGANNVLRYYSEMVDLTQYFPSFIVVSPDSYVLGGIWLAGIIVFSLCAYRSAGNTSEDKNSSLIGPTPEQQMVRKVKTIFASYSLALAVLLGLAFIAENIDRKIEPQLNINRGVRELLFQHNLNYYALVKNQIIRNQPLKQGELRFEYLAERRGEVNNKGPRFLVSGPREPFPKGHYTAYFNLLIADNSIQEAVVTLEVVAGRGTRVFSKKVLRGVDFSATGKYELFPVTFQLTENVQDLETRVYFYNRVNLNIKGIYIEPYLAELYYKAGLACIREGKYEQARVMFLRASSDSDYHPALYQLGVMEQLSGNWESSLQILKQVVRRIPNFADGHYRLGLAFKEKNNLEKAQEHFEQTTHLLPTHLDAWEALKETYLKLEMEEKAKSAEQITQSLYQPQYPYTINIANQLMFMGYSIKNSTPGKLSFEYYWKALSGLEQDKDYVFLVYFKSNGVMFQQDYVPQRVDPLTGQRRTYPTSQWEIGELLREEFEMDAPRGTFKISMGVRDPLYTGQRLPLASTLSSFWKITEIELESITIP